jgi:hypothetical protein
VNHYWPACNRADDPQDSEEEDEARYAQQGQEPPQGTHQPRPEYDQDQDQEDAIYSDDRESSRTPPPRAREPRHPIQQFDQGQAHAYCSSIDLGSTDYSAANHAVAYQEDYYHGSDSDGGYNDNIQPMMMDELQQMRY